MEIHFLNYSLIKIQRNHLELIRNWRNNEVREFMLFQETISIEMQLKWFDTINNSNNFYFLIQKDNLPIGLIDIKNIDWLKASADTGIFIALPEYRNGETSTVATVMSATFMAKILQLKTIYGKVLKSNKQAIAYNLATGFTIVRKEKNTVIMCVENIEITFLEILKLKQKLNLIHKEIKNYKVTLIINEESKKNDEAVNWLIENKIKKLFPKFTTDKELCIL